MTREEATTWFNGFVKDPDKGMPSAPDFLKGLTELYDTLEAQVKNAEEKDAKIRDLQDANVKLFLSMTGGRQEEEVEKELSLEDISKSM